MFHGTLDMSGTSLMVHLELGRQNEGLLQVAAALAERLHASVIGIAACQPMMMVYGNGYASAELQEQDSLEIGREMADAEAEFCTAFHNRTSAIEWRSSIAYASIADFVAEQSRSADLILTGAAAQSLFDASRAMNIGDLVMHAGRPVLLVPAATSTLRLDHVVIGWKETRETRRAVLDALPLLRIARQVIVVEVVREADVLEARARLSDVVDWLSRHGIEARSFAATATGDDIAQLNVIAQDYRADLIVAGAYGHSRIHEWALGGVTRELLLRPNRCSLVSH